MITAVPDAFAQLRPQNNAAIRCMSRMRQAVPMNEKARTPMSPSASMRYQA